MRLRRHTTNLLERYQPKSFPGGLTQPMWDSLKPEQFAACCSTLTDHAIARAVIGYCDGLNIHTFVGETKGRLSRTPKGTRRFYWDTIFCPDGFGDRTYAEIVKADGSGLGDKLAISQSIHSKIGLLLTFDIIVVMILERAKGFEPSTPTLARLCSILPGSRNRD